MFVLKESWIALLFLLFQHAAGFDHWCEDKKVHKTTVCEGQSVSLDCDSLFISVTDGNYGRTDGSTCFNGAQLPLVKTDCFQPTSLQILSTLCNGKTHCSVPATNTIFSDPCVGTYKYLTVIYECRPMKQSITCDGDQSVIDCERKNIVIQHANFGRRSLLHCPRMREVSTDCYSDQTNALRSRCNGKHSCRLNASKSVYGDPCFGVYKYLEVAFTCEEHSDRD